MGYLKKLMSKINIYYLIIYIMDPVVRGEDIMKVLDIQIGDPLPQKSDVEFFFEKNKFFKHEFLKNIKIYDNPLHNIKYRCIFQLQYFRVYRKL